MRTDDPAWSQLEGTFGPALTVDVEEWFHTCLVPEYVSPQLRPLLPRELDWLLPEVLDFLDEHSCRATFFVLGEVAREVPQGIMEIAQRGHEVGCHGYLHLRAFQREVGDLRRDIQDCKSLLEDLAGSPVQAFRAPEWSFRSAKHRGLKLLSELGFKVDSSLAPYPGAGSWGNPPWAGTLKWKDGNRLLELPPLSTSGPWRRPVSGWPGRLMTPGGIADAALRHQSAGGLPVMVVHPWELSTRPTPGELTGVSRFVHEMGRSGFRKKLSRVLDELPWTSLEESLKHAREASQALESLESTWVEWKEES